MIINPKHEARNSKQIQNSKVQNSKQKQAPTYNHFVFLACFAGTCFCFGHLFFGHLDLFRISDFGFRAFFKNEVKIYQHGRIE